MKDILDIHTHTIVSGHAYNTLFEMVHFAKEKGLEVLGVTEHAPMMPGTCHEFYFNNLNVVPREIEGVKLLLGSELNILDKNGKVDLGERTLKNLDICIASIHVPCFQKNRSIDDVTSAYIAACENPYISVIGHPDDGRFPVDWKALVKKAVETNTLLELNNCSLRPGGARENCMVNAAKMLEFCKEYGASVIMNSDAHVGVDVGNHDYPTELIKKMNFPEELVVNSSLDKFANFIQKKPDWL